MSLPNTEAPASANGDGSVDFPLSARGFGNSSLDFRTLSPVFRLVVSVSESLLPGSPVEKKSVLKI